MASSRPNLFRAVVDPNVFVSAWISRHGFPRRILEAAEDGRFEMVVSERLLGELSDVLSRERLRRYGTLELAEEHVRRVKTAAAVRVEVEGAPERLVPNDPKDDYLIALARASAAGAIVSGDDDLLTLHLNDSFGFREQAGGEIPAMFRPRHFVEHLDRGK